MLSDDDMLNADQHFLSIGVQYYLAGRSACLARAMPVDGNLFHHAIEMLLKARLSQTLTLEDLSRRPYGHNLCALWARFKAEFPNADLEQFDGIVTKLHSYERLRYPDNVMQEGATITMNWHAVSNGADMPPMPPKYDLVVEDIDRLVMNIFDVCSRNPAFYVSMLSDYGRDALTRHNRFANRWTPHSTNRPG